MAISNKSNEEAAANVIRVNRGTEKQKPHVVKYRESRNEIPPHIESSLTYENYYGEKQSFSIVNISQFGARIRNNNEDIALHSNEKIERVEIKLDDVVIFRGPVFVVNELISSHGVTEYGISLGNDGVDPNQVQAILEVGTDKGELATGREIVRLSESIAPEFKQLVADLNTLFQEIKMRLAQEDERIKRTSKTERHLKRMREHAVTIATSIYTEEIHRVFDKFKVLTDALNFEDSIRHKRYFRTNFHPLIIGAPFVQRAFEKPLGYSGDYGLMVMLYDYDDHGGNLFEKFIHRFACNEPASVANKNRVDLLCDKLLDEYENRKKPFKVSSIACGPAREVELFLSETKINSEAPISVVCVDQEEEALELASKNMRRIRNRKSSLSTTFLTEDAVIGIIKERPFVREIEESDVIISAGLFDYLSDRVSTKLIQKLYDCLAPEGLLIIGNVSNNNPSRFSMDYFMEWNLVLRSQDDLRAIVPEPIRSQEGTNIEVVAESLGLNLFLKIRKGK